MYFVQPFVLYGNGGAGKSALLSKSALQSLKVFYVALLQSINLWWIKSYFPKVLNCCRNGSPLQCRCSWCATAAQLQTPPLSDRCSSSKLIPSIWTCFINSNSTALGPLLKQFKLISCSGRFANKSATQTCFHSRTSQTTRSVPHKSRQNVEHFATSGSCHSLPQGASPAGHCEETASHLPRLRWRADRLPGLFTSDPKSGGYHNLTANKMTNTTTFCRMRTRCLGCPCAFLSIAR